MFNPMRLSVMLLTLLLLANPNLAQASPEPTKSKYFETFGGGITLDPRTQPVTINTVLTLQARQKIPLGAVVVADFENPANIDKPLRATHNFTSAENRITLISPNMSCVTNGQDYRVLVTLYADAKRTKILGTHEQLINFTVEPDQLQKLDIRLCQK
jgi:hypothetical protein